MDVILPSQIGIPPHRVAHDLAGIVVAAEDPEDDRTLARQDPDDGPTGGDAPFEGLDRRQVLDRLRPAPGRLVKTAVQLKVVGKHADPEGGPFARPRSCGGRGTGGLGDGGLGDCTG